MMIAENAKIGDLYVNTCKIKIRGTSYDAQVGYIVVPENHADPSSKQIALPVKRFLAISEQNKEPIFFLGGGPGQSNIKARPHPDLFQNRDFVLIGARGVDGSVVLDSPEIKKGMKGIGNDLLGKESLSNIQNAAVNYAQRLEEEGINLNFYTIPDVIEDIELARKSFGYQRINLRSGSYGTRVALLYKYTYPESIFRSVMESVNVPGGFVWEPDILDKQLEDFALLAANDPQINNKTSNLTSTIKNALDVMPKSWFAISLDPGKIKVVSYLMLFDLKTAAAVFNAYIAAEKGDYGGLALMSVAYKYVVPSMFKWGEMASKALSADYDPSRDYAAELEPPGSTMGSPFAKLIWSIAPCLPIKQINDELRQLQPTDTETLMISGSLDVSTPKEGAESLLKYLSHGHHVLLSQRGHVNKFSGQLESSRNMMKMFYDTGIVDSSHFRDVAMDFDARGMYNLPILAKLGMGIFLLTMALAMGTVLFFILPHATSILP